MSAAEVGLHDAPATGARILVCGGREFADRDCLFSVLDKIHAAVPIGIIIHGAATGTDTLAAEWAKERGVAAWAFKAAWGTFGRNAGPLRNAKMLREGMPHMVIAFKGGDGTENMIRQSVRAGVKTIRQQ